LREPLLSGLGPWLCYYCGDCSTNCPRETEPAEAMMTVRRYLTTQYDWTGLASKIHRSRAWAIGAHVAVGAVVVLLVVLYHLHVVGLEFRDLTSSSMGLEHMFDTITMFTRSVFLIALFFLISSAFRMYRFTVRGRNAAGVPLHLYVTEARTLLAHALGQLRFRDCSEHQAWIRHLLLVFGCSVMSLVPFFFLDWFQTDEIFPLYHPQRWLGYAAAGALIYATGDILIGRVRKRRQAHRFSNAADLILPVSLLLTAVTGIAVHILRFAELSLAAHYAYALHLAVVVPLVIVEIPFGKASHMIYRPLAIYLHRVGERASHAEVAGEAVGVRAG
jgi:hypothetical protein